MPSWLFEREFDFPSDTYLSSLGTGDTLQASRKDAIQQLVLYFDSEIKVRSTSDLTFRETKDSFDKTKNLSEKVEVAGEADLPSLRFTESFFDQKSGQWYICAYLNKSEFLQLVKSQVQTGIKKLELACKIQEEISSFSQFISLSATLKEGKSFERKAKQMMVLNVESGKKLHSALLSLSKKCERVREELKSRLQFCIQIEGDFEEIVSTALSEILEEHGFVSVIAEEGERDESAQLWLKGRVKSAINENDTGVFVTPRLTLQIVDAQNKKRKLASYSKSYKKWGHINLDDAMRKAFVEMEKDLKVHFMDFFYSL